MNLYEMSLGMVGTRTRQIDVQADYIYYLTGSAGGADPTIEFRPIGGGEVVYLKPGQAYKMPARQRGMGSSWILRNMKGEGDIVAQILMGEGEFQDNRISGSVEVIDGGKARTMANIAYSASAGIDSDATSAPAIFLQNPAGSGKIIIVKSVSVSVSKEQAYGLCWTDGVTGVQQTAQAVVSKSQQGVFAAKVWRHSTGQRAMGAQNSLATATLPANGIDKTVFQEPIVIRPGMQICAFGTSVQSSIIATMECVEEVIQ